VTPGRLEAFSDGVIAILITIMVLEFHAPSDVSVEALKGLCSPFACYAMSFVFLGIYWNNHHHMMHSVEHVDGAVLWANLHLLFWLSLTPFVTQWMGTAAHPFAPLPVAAYGVLLLLSAIAYYILTLTLVRVNGKNSKVAQALGKDFKGKISVVVYLLGVPLAFVTVYASLALYVAVSLMWLVPDKRFEHQRHHG